MAAKTIGRAAGAVLVAIALPASTSAQILPADKVAERADARLQRLESTLAEPRAARGPLSTSSTTTVAKDPEFTLTIAVPLAYNSNIENAGTGEIEAFHAAPSAKLDWAHQLSPNVTLIARIAADYDWYPRHSEDDGATLGGRIGVVISDAKLGPIRPYAHYTPTMIYAGFFEQRQVTTHTFAIGAKGKTPVTPTTKLSFDLQYARREATVATSEFDRGLLALGFEGKLGDKGATWSVSETIVFKQYRGGTNIGRRDTNFLTEAGISIPLNDTGDDSRKSAWSVDIGVTFERNTSNRAAKEYSVWDVGPSFGLSKAF
jgi:hypothetical protein